MLASGQSKGLPTLVDYATLGAKQQEIYNFQKVAALLADYGFNCIKLADDWNGADFIADHLGGDLTLRVQLKGRLTIAKKYSGKALQIAFPIKEVWYIVDHDQLVEFCGVHTDWLKTSSWVVGGHYSSMSANPGLKAALAPFALGSLSITHSQ